MKVVFSGFNSKNAFGEILLDVGYVYDGFDYETEVESGIRELYRQLDCVEKDGKYGFTYNMRASNATDDVIYRYEDVHLFSEGLAAVKIGGRWGFVDFFERMVIPCIFDKVTNFHFGTAEVSIMGKKYIIDKLGVDVSSYLTEEEIELMRLSKTSEVGFDEKCMEKFYSIRLDIAKHVARKELEYYYEDESTIFVPALDGFKKEVSIIMQEQAKYKFLVVNHLTTGKVFDRSKILDRSVKAQLDRELDRIEQIFDAVTKKNEDGVEV